MSLLINGMGMPRCCKECGLLIDEDFSCDSSPHYCAVNQYLRWRDWSEVPEYISADCPLVEISTPHGRLIDADAYQYSGDLIDEPTIIEAEQGDG